MRNDFQRLCRSMAILVVLGGGIAVLTSTQMTRTALAVDYCSYCSPFYDYCEHACDLNFLDCIQSPTPNCSELLDQCSYGCQASYGLCTANCATTPPSGGPGGRTKTPCEQSCYASRSECTANQGIPDVEECIDGGGSVVFCCHQAFSDCMIACG